MFNHAYLVADRPLARRIDRHTIAYLMAACKNKKWGAFPVRQAVQSALVQSSDRACDVSRPE